MYAGAVPAEARVSVGSTGAGLVGGVTPLTWVLRAELGSYGQAVAEPSVAPRARFLITLSLYSS